MENLTIEEANGITTTKPLAVSKEELNKAITELSIQLITELTVQLTILQTNASTVEAGTNLKLESLSNSVYALQEQLDSTKRMLTALAITSSIFAALVVNLYFN